MRKTDSPPTVWPTPIVVAYAALFSLNLWFTYRYPIVLAICVIGWLFIWADLMRVLTTELTKEGFSQRTLRGRQYLAWAEVEQVSRNEGHYWVTGRGLKLLLRPGLFEDPEAARTFIEERLPSGRMSLPESLGNEVEESTSLWIPGKFRPQPASHLERLWIRYSPPGWEYVLYVGLLIPGTFLEYAIFRGHVTVGVVGLLVWAPILWLLVVAFHQAGRVRIWLSLLVILLAYLAIDLLIVGAF